MEKMYLSYDQIHKLCKNIADDVRESGWQPDCMLAIAGGGLIPARMLRAHLQIPIYLVGLQRYDDTKLVSDEPLKMQWLDNPDEQIAGKKVLMVDEVDDTRKTLSFAAEELEQYNLESLRIAVITQKDKEKAAEFPEGVEHVYAGKHIGDIWVQHPWESLDIDEHNSHVKEL